MMILVLEDNMDRFESIYYHYAAEASQTIGARNYREAKAAIDQHVAGDIVIDYIMLDHDLGDFSGDGGKELTGFDVAKYLVASGLRSIPVRIHSWNPEGAKRMAETLTAAGFDVEVKPWGKT